MNGQVMRSEEELRLFLRVVYRALRMVTVYLEKRYGFGRNQ
jgi:hypothetical protein